MRVVLPALVLAFSGVSSATFFWSEADDGDQFAVGEPKTIQWQTTDFDANVDIYVGDEDANEDADEGKLIASDVPNVGLFTWTPDQSDLGDQSEIATNKKQKKKKKIWGKDKKGKKNKGKKLIEIIIGKPGKVKKPIETPPQQTVPPPPYQPSGTTLTSIATLTSVINTHVTATHTVITTTPGGDKDKDKPKNPTTVVVPPPAPVPTQIVTPLPPPPEQPPNTIVTSEQPPLFTNTPVPSRNETLIAPSATTGVTPPLFTGGAVAIDAKPVIVGALIGGS